MFKNKTDSKIRRTEICVLACLANQLSEVVTKEQTLKFGHIEMIVWPTSGNLVLCPHFVRDLRFLGG